VSLVPLLALVAVALLLLVGGGALVARSRRSTKALPPPQPRPGIDYAPGVGDDDTVPRDTPRRIQEAVELPDVVEAPTEQLPGAVEVETPPTTAGRLGRLRGRLARSNNALGRGLLSLLSRDTVDASTWDEVEEVLLLADVGIGPTQELVARLKERLAVEGAGDPERVKQLLKDELLALIDPSLDRSVRATPTTDDPAVVLVVGVNGTGKTTTTGKLARNLVAEGHSVVLGAADTFRAAATQQLQTWGERVGAGVVTGPEGGDPASVAFDAVKTGIDNAADVVLIDTAGRLHTKTGLMDELGKVKRVVEKLAPVSEVLLVLDATTGQNGLRQAQVFGEVVDVTGIVLTKLDGTAKGGIVIAVQRELDVPVKLVGLGEGPDDLAPFDPVQFVDALVDGDV
jgi:fused signal recognition particle receptor